MRSRIDFVRIGVSFPVVRLHGNGLARVEADCDIFLIGTEPDYRSHVAVDVLQLAILAPIAENHHPHPDGKFKHRIDRVIGFG